MISKIVYMIQRIVLLFCIFLMLAVHLVRGADGILPVPESEQVTMDSFLFLKSRADDLEEQEKFREALDVWQEARELTEGTLPEAFAISLIEIGDLYQWMDSLDLAMESYYNSMELSMPLQLDSLKAKAYTEMARIFTATGNYDRAHELYLKSIVIKESMQDEGGLRRSYYDLGALFFYYQHNYEIALRYFREAENIPVDTNGAQVTCVLWMAIGSTYEKLGDLQSAREYNTRAYELSVEKGFPRETGYALQNIGTTWLALEKYDLALENLRTSMRYFREINHIQGLVISMNYLGKVHLEMGDFKEGIEVFSESLQIAREKNLKPHEIQALDGLAKAHEQTGDFQSAYRFLYQSKSLKETIEDEETATSLARQRAQFDLNRKEQELVEVRKENEILAQKRKLDQRVSQFTVALAGAGLILLLVILFSYDRQKKNNKLLAEKNAKIKKQNKVLEEQNLQIENQNRKLEEANSELTQFAYVASHDLKEPLRTIASFSKLIEKRSGHQFDSFVRESFGFITQAVDRMKLLLDDLLAYSRIDRPQSDLDQLNIGLVLNDVISNLKGNTTENNATIEVNFENMPEIKGIRTHFTQLFQNIISNGIKFRKEEVDPQVVIDCLEDEKYFTFSIADNGIGIPAEAKTKIFEMFTRLNNKHRYTGTGIGLATCKKIVDYYQGNIWVESTEGTGSTFLVQFPREA